MENVKIDENDKAIIRALQDDFPLERKPFEFIAKETGIPEDEVMRRVRGMIEDGRIRKMGAVLRHREIGYVANVLCVWRVPEDSADRIASMMVRYPQISHVCLRKTAPGWPYNLYTMVHGRSRAECDDIVDKLARENGIADHVMLYTVRELKKESMKYFLE